MRLLSPLVGSAILLCVTLILSQGVHAAPNVTSVHPPLGPLAGGTPVVFKGVAFDNTTQYHCNMDHPGWPQQPLRSRGVFLSPTEFACTAPPCDYGGPCLPGHTVSVSLRADSEDPLDSGSWTVFGVNYTYHGDVEVDSVVPDIGEAGDAVSVVGNNFHNTTYLRCKFGNTVVPGIYVSVGVVDCPVPAHAAGDVELTVSNNAVEFSAESVPFLFRGDVTVSSLSPPSGPIAGSTTVVVAGSNFFPGAECKFGTSTVTGTWASYSQISCDSPSVGGPQVVAVEVANPPHTNFTDNGVIFSYLSDHTVTEVQPKLGPHTGGSTVTILGSGFLNSAFGDCRFRSPTTAFPDQVSGGATFVTPTKITCVTPSLIGVTPQVTLPSGVTVEVSYANNGNQFAPTAGVTAAEYSFYQPPNVTSISTHNGPTTGGTLVTLLGDQFVPITGAEMRCQFGNTAVTANVISPSEMTCVTPLGTGIVNLEISNNNRDFTTLGNSFEYRTPPVLDTIQPENAGQTENTTITVTGSNFFNPGPEHEPELYFGTTAVPAVYVDSATLTALSPVSLSPQQVAVTLSFNGGADHTTQSKLFGIDGDLSISSVTPAFGPADGDTLVVIQGANFVNRDTLRCRFGNVEVTATWTSDTQIYCIAPASGTGYGEVTLSVSNNGRSFVDAAGGYNYVISPTVSGLAPERGPNTGGTLVEVTGLNFTNAGLGVCQFGSALRRVPAAFVSTTKVTCITPRVGTGAEVASVLYTDNGYNETAAPVSFSFDLPLNMSSISVSSGPSSGGTSVTLSGSNFVNAPGLRVRFGSLPPATPSFTSATELVAVSPSSPEESLVSVDVTINDQDYTTSGLVFTFDPLATISSIVPSTGPATGLNIVTVHGTNFSNTDRLVCVFNSTIVDARYWSSEEVTCEAPAGPAGTIAEVQVSNNGGVTASSTAALVYSYYEPIILHSLSVQSGPDTGGTTVTVSGLNFRNSVTTSQETMCRFGDGLYKVIASHQSSNTIVCTTPEQPPASGLVVAVSNNGHTFSPQTNVTFTVYASPVLDQIVVTRGVTGGGTDVSLRGSGFINSTDFVCAVGGIQRPTTFISSTAASCVTPPSASGIGAVTVDISANGGVDWTASYVSFTYIHPATVTSVSPAFGVASGGTLLTVQGTNFTDTVDLACRFNGNQTQVSQALWASAGTLLCATTSGVNGSTVTVEVSNNGADFTSDGETFQYYADPVVSSVTPVLGPGSGATAVTVTGSNFFDGINQCWFGNFSSSATVISPTEVRCNSPPRFPGLSRLSFSANGGSDKSNTADYLFHDDLVLASISRPLGPITGGSNLTFTGTGFLAVPTAACRFGTFAPVTALFESDNTVYCESPAVPSPRVVTVEVSLNDQDFTSFGQTFEYVHAPNVTSFLPVSGPLGGSTIVRVVGNHFVHSKYLQCQFDDLTPVPAVWISSTYVECLSPPGVTTVPRPLEVSVNALDFTTNAELYRYQPQHTVTKLSPAFGPVTGNSPISVIGENFRWGPGTLLCRFGDGQFVTASFHNSTVVICNAPPQNGPGPLAVEVTNNAQDYSSGGQLYTYVESAHVVSLTPGSGPYTGGTTVTVFGSDFLAGQTYVKFGDADSILTTFNSTSHFVVNSPAYSAGTYAVEVSTNDVDFSHDGVLFTYTGEPEVYSLQPNHGPLTGNTRVTVNGVNFQNSVDLVCKFGTLPSVDGQFIGPFRVACVSPPLGTTGSVPVEIAIHNGTTNFSTQGVPFTYDPLISLSDISPVKGPLSGGTVVNVTGSDIQANGPTGVTCRFGVRVAPATFLDNTTAQCVSPFGLTAEAVAVEMSNNDQNYTQFNLTFSYQDDISISDLIPFRGPESGATSVTVVGTNFVNSPDLQCRFGTVGIVSASFTSATEIVCASPPASSSPLSVSVEVTNNVYDYTTEAQQFTYQAVETVSSISPTVGTSRGGSLVSVAGTNFADTNDLTCRFSVGSNHATTMGLWRTATLTLCTSPTNYHWGDANVTVEISNNAHDFTSSGSTFLYLDAPTVTGIEPDGGPVIGGSPVTVLGANFTQNAAIYCRFEYTQVAIATWINSSAVVCDSPPHPDPEVVAIEISTDNGETFTNASGVFFAFRTVQEITSLDPDRGPASGGTVITIAGSGFVNDPESRCRVGTVVQTVTFVDSQTIECVAPANPSGAQPVDVSSNGYDWTSSFITYTYDAVPTITDVLPVSGPVSGGTVITVGGTSLINTNKLACRFDNTIIIAAVYHGTTLLHCDSPAHAAGTVNLEVSTNGLDWYPTGSSFTFYTSPTLTGVYPTHGPRLGGSPLTLTGTGFASDGNFTVSIGYDYNVICNPANDTHAFCDSPPVAPYAGYTGTASGQGTAPVQVSNNGEDYTSSAVTFTFDADSSVTSLTPSVARASVGTTVTLTGYNFVNTGGELRCKFASAVTAATYVSNTTVTCALPPHAAQQDYVELTSNNLDYTSSHALFEYLADETVVSVDPAMSLVTGGTLITVVGTNFVKGHGIACVFGAEPAVSAFFLNDTAVLCETPVVTSAGARDLEIANNGVNPSTSNVQVTFYAATVDSINPTTLQEEDPVQDITLTGTGFAAIFAAATTIECEWSSASFTDKIRTPNSGTTGTTVDCPTAGAMRTGDVNVTVVLDNTFVLPSSAVLSFTPCPPGFYCVSNTQYPCPVGAKCPAPGRNDNYTLCAPGTYQHQTQQLDCITCDAGFYCPTSGMTAPKLCPAGFICLAGTATPHRLCLPGHYCANGTATDTPDDGVPIVGDAIFNAQKEWTGVLRVPPTIVPINFNPYPGIPLLCQAGFYCRGNIPYHPTIAPVGATTFEGVDGDITTPQKCLPKFSCPKGSSHPQGSGACQPGYFCAAGQAAQACPNGTYAQGQGNLKCTDCAPGTFMSGTAAELCDACPLGFICPDVGMIAAKPCPAGWICDTEGLADPSTPCPAGYYCLEGTATSTGTGPTSAKPCPAGYFCTSGVSIATPYTLGELAALEANMSAPSEFAAKELLKAQRPQFCQIGKYCLEATAGEKAQKECELGYYCPLGSKAMIPANPGSYVGARGRSVETPCPIGSFSEFSAAKECTPCPAGYYCPRSNMTGPIVCAPGTYRLAFQANGLRCVPCATGTVDVRFVNLPTSFHDAAGIYGDHVESCLIYNNCTNHTALNLGDRTLMHNWTSNAYGQSRTPYPTLAQPSWGDVISGKYGRVVAAMNSSAGDGGIQVNFYGTSVTYGTVRYSSATNGSAAPSWWHPVVMTHPDQCIPCPEGFSCTSRGMYNLTQTDLCPPGRYCYSKKENSNWRNYKEPCPPSYYCYAGATDKTKAKYRCEAGLYCETGTSAKARHQQACRAGFYCPEGSSRPEQLECPEATDSKQGAKRIEDCTDVNYERRKLNPGFTELRPRTSDVIDQNGDLVINQWEGLNIFYSLRGLRGLGIEYGRQLEGVFELSLNSIRYRPRSQVPNVRARLLQDISNSEGVDQVHAELRMHLFQQSVNSSSALVAVPEALPMPPSLVTKDDVAGTEEISLRVTSEQPDLHLRVGLVVLHGRFVSNTSIFQDRIRVESIRPTRSASQPDQTFFCVVENNAELDLPLNLPQAVTGGDVATVGFTPNITSTQRLPSRDPFKSVQAKRAVIFQNESVVITPHLPFFSACQNYDSYVVLYQVLEDRSQCTLATEAETQFLTPWSPVTTPSGDVCDYQLQCVYEERIDRIEFLPRWYESVSGTTLFHITRQPTPISQSSNTGFFEGRIGSKHMVPVRVIRPNNIPAHTVPREVTLDLRYHQVTDTEKHILTASVVLSNYKYPCVSSDGLIEDQCYQDCSVCQDRQGTVVSDPKPDLHYNLRIKYTPLAYVDLLVLFAFDVPLYATIFTCVALFTLMTVMVFWVVHRILGASHDRVRLNFGGYFKMTVLPHYLALAANMLSIGTGLTLIWLIMGYLFDLTRTIPGDFRMYDGAFVATLTLDKATAEAFFTGRYALALIVFGIIVLYYGSMYLIPHEVQSLEEQVAGVNHSWKRSHLIMVTLSFTICLVFLLEFSYSDTYASYLYIWIIIFQALKLVASQSLLHLLAERLLVDCLILAYSLSQYAMLLGASNYFHFLGGFFMTLWLDVLTAIYFLRWWRHYSPGIFQLIRNSYRKARNLGPVERDEMSTEDAIDTAAYEMLSYLSYVGVSELALLCSPVVFYYLFLFASELRLHELYPIPPGSIILYFVGVLIVVTMMVLSAVFLHNLQELKMDWRIFQYLEYTQQRFRARGSMWRSWSAVDIDYAIHPHFHSLDALCFSVHYYIMLMFYAAGMLTVLFGIEMSVRTKYKASSSSTDRYNIWTDPLSVPIAILVLVLCMIAKATFLGIVGRLRSWQSKSGLTEDFSIGLEKVNMGVQCDEDEIRRAQEMVLQVTKLGSSEYDMSLSRPPKKLDYNSDQDLPIGDKYLDSTLPDFPQDPAKKPQFKYLANAGEYRIIQTPEQGDRPRRTSDNRVESLLNNIMEEGTPMTPPKPPLAIERPKSREDLKRLKSAEQQTRAQAHQRHLIAENAKNSAHVRRLSDASDLESVLDEHRRDVDEHSRALQEQRDAQADHLKEKVKRRRESVDLRGSLPLRGSDAIPVNQGGELPDAHTGALLLDDDVARITEAQDGDGGDGDLTAPSEIERQLEAYLSDTPPPVVPKARYFE